jgi:hypothetical protein
MPKLKNVVHVRVDAQGKKFYTTCGAIVTTKAGGECLILNYMPVDSNGIFQLYAPDKKDAVVAQPAVEQSATDDPF